MLLFLVLGMQGKALVSAGWSPIGFVCTAIPFTPCDVPSPLIVSSSLSILSHANVVKRPGLMFCGSWMAPPLAACFWRQRAVSIDSTWEYETPSQSIQYLYQFHISGVSDLTAKGNMFCRLDFAASNSIKVLAEWSCEPFHPLWAELLPILDEPVRSFWRNSM